MICYRHRLPTTNEITTLKQICLKMGDAQCNPLSFSDQVSVKFYQQVIDIENYNVSSKIFQMPVLLRLTEVIQSFPSVTRKLYLQ
jgi:hypothetical protein